MLKKERYRALVEAEGEAYAARVRSSLEDIKAGRVKRGTAKDLIKELNVKE